MGSMKEQKKRKLNCQAKLVVNKISHAFLGLMRAGTRFMAKPKVVQGSVWLKVQTMLGWSMRFRWGLQMPSGLNLITGCKSYTKTRKIYIMCTKCFMPWKRRAPEFQCRFFRQTFCMACAVCSASDQIVQFVLFCGDWVGSVCAGLFLTIAWHIWQRPLVSFGKTCRGFVWQACYPPGWWMISVPHLQTMLSGQTDCGCSTWKITASM